MMSDFNVAIQSVLAHEGGYVNNPDDPGGETNFGLSKHAYPGMDIKNLTREKAMAICYQDWWVKHNYALIEDQALATHVLDISVHMGAKAAHRLLQRALIGCSQLVTVDGIIGKATLTAVNQTHAYWLLDRFRLEVMTYYLEICRKNPLSLKLLPSWIRRALT